MDAAAESNPNAAFQARVAGLEAAGLPVAWAGPSAMASLAEAVERGADGERLLEAAVSSGLEASVRARSAWRPWFYPGLVCAGAALGAAVLAIALGPVFQRVYAEFRVAPGTGMGFLESARGAAGWLACAAAAASLVAWRAATVWRSRQTPHDPLRTALACATLAALADAGTFPDQVEGVIRGIGADSNAVPFAAWATGEDLGGVPRGEALRLAARVATARASQRHGEARRFGRIVTSVVLAGFAVLAYALVVFLPALDFLRAVGDASAASR